MEVMAGDPGQGLIDRQIGYRQPSRCEYRISGDLPMITMLTHLANPKNANPNGIDPKNVAPTNRNAKNADPLNPDISIEPPIERELDIAAAGVDGLADRSLRLAAGVGRWLPRPGAGETALRWRSLTALASGDLTAARVIEAHTDALAILAEAQADPDVATAWIDEGAATEHSTWGVFAAEGSGVRVDATPD